MDPSTRRVVGANALQTVLRDLEAHAPEAGPFPARRWDFELPLPYGPMRRLVIRLEPVPGDAEACSMLGDVSGAGQLLGAYPSRARARDALENGDALGRLETFLEWALEDVDELLEAMQPFDLPLVAIDREGTLFAVLDHRDTGIERWGPGDLQCVWWRLLLHDGGSWHDAGVANSQAAAMRSMLHERVLKTLAAFDGLSIGEFSFRLWTPSPGEIGEPIRGTHSFQLGWGSSPQARQKGSGRDLHRHRAAIARLREICSTMINAAPNQGDALLQAVRAIADGTRAGEEDAAAHGSRRRSRVLDALTSALRRIAGLRSW